MKTVLGILSTLFLLASPWVLYVTLSQQRIDVAAITLVGWVLLRTIPVFIMAKPAHRMAALQLPAIALCFALIGLISNNGTWLLVLPSATQAGFAIAFLRSLALGRTPLIEHYARMVKPELRAGEVVHCRQWTRIWGAYLIVLSATGLVLAATVSLKFWTLWVGVVSYVLVGALFAVEYVVRKIRFRDYGRNPLDWMLGKLFPATRSSSL